MAFKKSVKAEAPAVKKKSPAVKAKKPSVIVTPKKKK